MTRKGRMGGQRREEEGVGKGSKRKSERMNGYVHDPQCTHFQSCR